MTVPDPVPAERPAPGRPAASRPVDARPPWLRPLLWLVLVVALGGLGLAGHVEHSLSVGGFRAPDSEAARAADRLELEFGVGSPDVLVPVDTASPAGQRYVAQLTESARGAEGVTSVDVLPPGPDEPGAPTVVAVDLAGGDDEVQEGLERLRDGAPAPPDGVRTEWTGRAVVLHEDDAIGREDLARAELVAVPVTLVLLVLVFGGVVAALLPVVVGVLAIGVSMALLSLLVEVMPVSVFALNLVTGLALGLAIDYSLLLVTRYRERLRDGDEPGEALRLSVSRTRRTILVSAVTVALSLAALLAVDLPYLRSMAVAGICVLAAVVVLTLVVVPPVLAWLGTRVDAWSVRRVDPTRPGRLTAAVIRGTRRHRLLVAGVTAVVLGVLVAPIAGLRLGPLDDRVLPADAGSRVGAEWLRETRPELATEPLTAVVDSGDAAVTAAYAEDLSRVPGVRAVRTGDATYVGGAPAGPGEPGLMRPDARAVRVQPVATDSQPAQQDLAEAVRAVPADAPVAVAGVYAEDADTRAAISGRVPLVATLLVLAVLPVIFLLTRGVLVSVKTVVMAVLSLAASLGVMVFVFQEGHLASLVGVAATGVVDATTPVLLFCLAFGLSMDYQVFLLARIREEYDTSGDNDAAVTAGIERTAPIIGAAAMLVAVVFLAIGSSGVSVVRLLGVGLALAVLVDAFVVRLLLVPALMFLLGRANWWAPRSLDRAAGRLRIE